MRLLYRGVVLATSLLLPLLTSAQGLPQEVPGEIVQVIYDGIPGTFVGDLTTAPAYPDNPTRVIPLTENVEAPANLGDAFGSRIRLQLIAPETGNYTFYIASDDSSELWLSTDEKPANATFIASVASWTDARQWTKEPNQQSAPISLVQGQAYYLEALHKEGGGGENLAVGWKLPGSTTDPSVISLAYAVPYVSTPRAPSFASELTSVTTVQNRSVLLRPKLDASPPLQFQWYRGTEPIPGATLPGYSFVPTLADNNATFSLRVTNSLGHASSSDITLTVLGQLPAPEIPGEIVRVFYEPLPGGLIETLTSAAIFPNDYTRVEPMSDVFASPENRGDQYGSRVQAFVIPPQTGNYTFWVAGDDQTQLWLSTDEQPANRQLIAAVTSWSAAREWTKEPGQQSAPVSLVAGQAYYLEVLQKDGGGGDHFAIGWQWPDGTLERPLSLDYILPYVASPRTPTFLGEAETRTVFEASPVLLRCKLDASLPLSFQWYRDADPIIGATSPTYAWTPAVADSGAVFSLRVTNSLGHATSPTISFTVLADPLVTFPDPILETVVREHIAKPSGTLRASDLLVLTNLSCNSRGITSLSGIEAATNLLRVDLRSEQVTSLAPLSSLPHLSILYLASLPVTDIQPLTAIPTLTELSLVNLNLAGYAPLSQLVNLETLQLTYCDLAELGFLSSLSGLRNLTLWDQNRIDTLTAISGLVNLESLSLFLGSGPAYDLSVLAPLSSLTGLSVGSVDTGQPATVTGLEVLSSLPSLRSLGFRACSISDWTPVTTLTALTGLSVPSCGLSSLSAFSNLTNLRNLGVQDNYISDLTAVASMLLLEDLRMTGNPIGSLNPVSSLSLLMALDADSCGLTDISPLVGLTGLKHVNLTDNRLTTIDALANLYPWAIYLDMNLLDVSAGSAALTVIQTLQSRGAWVSYENQQTTPSIYSHPVSQSVRAGSTVTFSVGASGATSYQWRHNDLPLEGETSATLTLVNVQEADAGRYQVEVSNALGSSLSQEAALTVISSDPVAFVDPQLESALRSALGIPAPTPITEWDMANLTQFTAWNQGITSLSGMETAVNLQYANFGANPIVDLTPLSGLPSLRDLWLTGMPAVPDLTPIAGMTQLRGLALEGPGFDDQAVVQGLVNLTLLWVPSCGLTDLAFIQPLTQLQDLNVSENPIGNLAALANHPSLSTLRANGCGIGEISILAGFPQLRVVELARNALTSIDALGLITQPQYVYLVQNYLDVTDGSTARNVISTLQGRGGQVEYLPQYSAGLPQITSPPASRAVAQGSDVTFTHGSSGGTSYQWYRDNTEISGATGPTLVLSNVQKTDAGRYVIEVRNPFGSVRSADAVLTVADDTPVVFADANLVALLRERLNKPTGEITELDMLTLTALDAGWRNIQDLTGLGAAVNLEHLFLVGNPLTNIGALSEMAKLRYLELGATGVTQLESLSSLVNLEWLFLYGCGLTSVPDLSALAKLRFLNVDNNRITDLGPVTTRTTLETLLAGQNPVQSLEPLLSLPHLSQLSVGTLTNVDLSPVANLPALRDLSLRTCRGVNLSPVYGLTALQSLTVDDCQIMDLSVFSGLVNLTTFNFPNNGVTDISVVSGMPNLWNLQFYGNPIVDLEPVRTLVKLENICGDYCRVDDLSVLENLPKLRYVSFIGNLLTDVSVLVNLPLLQQVTIYHNFLDVTAGSASQQVIDSLLQRGVGVSYLPQYGPPQITMEPASRTVGRGSYITLGVGHYVGTEFQWYHDNAPIAGATNATYSIAVVQDADAGLYAVEVRNPLGSIRSQDATLTVADPVAPSIPWIETSRTAYEGGWFTLSVQPSGTESFTYQWLYEDVDISGATNQNLTKGPVQFSDAGEYRVRVSNSAGSVLSAPITVTVLSGEPVITQQPRSVAVFEGETASFWLSTDGAWPQTVQWQLNGSDLPGATSWNLTVNNVTAANQGEYRAVVTNSKGSVTSLAATLTVLVDEVVTIPDANLEAAIRQSLGLPTGAISRRDMLGLQYLSAQNVQDLAGLENALNLYSLQLNNSPVVNWSPLGLLSNLGELRLFSCGFSDATVLQGLVRLREAYLGGNLISDLTPFRNLPSLETLAIDGDNPVQDLSPLVGSPKLRYLAVGRTALDSLVPLTQMPTLRSVGFQQTTVADWTPLGSMTWLQELRIYECGLTDLSPFASLTELTQVALMRNLLMDIGVLAGLPKLQYAWLENNFLNLTVGSPAETVIQGLLARGVQVSYLPQNSGQPAIGGLPAVLVTASGVEVSATFGVADAETPVEQLIVTAVSSDQALLPDTSIGISGTGAERLLTMTPSTGATGAVQVTVSVLDTDNQSTSASLQLTVAETPPLNGQGMDGYIAGAVVFFDANLNGTRDAGEPSTTTDNVGRFTLNVPLTPFDVNHSGRFDPAEGRLVLTGGVDIATGLALKTPLTAPPGATVVSPLTTLLSEIVAQQGAAADVQKAEADLQKALNLPAAVPLQHYDPIQAAVLNDANAAAVMSAAAKVQDTIVQVSAMLESAASAAGAGVTREQAAQSVTAALASEVQVQANANSQVNLTQTAVVSSIVTTSVGIVESQTSESLALGSDVVQAAATVIAEVNAVKEEIAETAMQQSTTDPQAMLVAIGQITQVQVVAQAEAADDLADLASGQGNVTIEDVLYANTSEQLTEQVESAPVGTLAEPPPANAPTAVSFSRPDFRVREDGVSIEAVTVIRTGDTSGTTVATVTFAGGMATAGEDYAAASVDLTFAPFQTSQTLNLASIILQDIHAEGDETVGLTLSVSGSEQLGAISAATLTIADDDQVGTFAFSGTAFMVREDGKALAEVGIVRQDGTSGEVNLIVTPSAGTAEAGADFVATPVTVTFASGSVGRKVIIPVMRDKQIEGVETVQLSLALADGAPAGALLGAQIAATLTIIDAATAIDDVVVRRPGQTVKFSAAQLLRNDGGAGPLSLVGLAAAGVNGGTLSSLGNGWFLYTPPAGLDGDDTVGYTVRAADGSIDTGSVAVRLESAPPALPLPQFEGGVLKIRFVGIPGRSYTLQKTTDLADPSGWADYSDPLTADPTGLMGFEDDDSSGNGFYRILEQ